MRNVRGRPDTTALRQVGGALLLMLPPVVAQTASPAESDSLQTVVVTGSRIRGEVSEPTGPVTVLTKEQVTRGGNDSLGKVLQTLPYNTGSPANTNVNALGDGSTRIDLRGLEPQRTVTLLNGRRLPNGGIGADASVDIDSLPLSMIERVEVLTTGASAVYGADAIGGVVNVITRSHFKGVELGLQRSETERGDGTITRAQALLGDDVGQGHWMLGADYVDQHGVSMASREYSAVPLAVASVDGARVPSGSSAIPDGFFEVPDGNALALSPGVYTRVPGASGQTAADWRPYADETFNFAPYTYLQTPNERGSLWLLGTQPLSGGGELFFEGLFSHRESSQQLAPAFIATRSDVPANNIYNPFGVDIPFGVRRVVELQTRSFSQRVEMWRALAGVRGQIGQWRWEVSAATSESNAATQESGLPLAERLPAGLGPSGHDVSGRIVCGAPDPVTGIVPASAVVDGCVPINLFGGAGSITQQQLEYMAGALRDDGYSSQRLAAIGFDGAWGRLPAGEILWALGGEFRRDSGAYRYDPQRLGGIEGLPLAADIPGGSFEAREGYGEMRVPLLDEQSGWGNLDATLGGRVSDFSTFGTHPTWHGGMHWKLSSAWAMRADYSTLFRAPALNELYQAQVAEQSFQETDPCGNSPTPEQQANCAANGVPGGSYVQTTNATYLLHAGGNTDLKPEEGYSFDAGVEFRSTDAAAWQASVDVFRTRLDRSVESPGENAILSECADHGTALACGKIQRLADGSISSIDTRLSNYGRVTVEGIDFATSVGLASRAGGFNLHALATNLLRHDVQIFEGGDTLDRVGRANFGFALPEWRALGGVTWTREAWNAGYSLQWIGAYVECARTEEGEPYCHDVPSVVYHDLDASYQWSGIAIRMGINNLTDREPPFLSSGREGNTLPATYRLLGRTYFMQVSYAMK
jgi:outer membrane receptor protein involved in Fe transport